MIDVENLLDEIITLGNGCRYQVYDIKTCMGYLSHITYKFPDSPSVAKGKRDGELYIDYPCCKMSFHFRLYLKPMDDMHEYWLTYQDPDDLDEFEMVNAYE